LDPLPLPLPPALISTSTPILPDTFASFSPFFFPSFSLESEEDLDPFFFFPPKIPVKLFLPFSFPLSDSLVSLPVFTFPSFCLDPDPLTSTLADPDPLISTLTSFFPFVSPFPLTLVSIPIFIPFSFFLPSLSFDEEDDEEVLDPFAFPFPPRLKSTSIPPFPFAFASFSPFFFPSLSFDEEDDLDLDPFPFPFPPM